MSDCKCGRTFGEDAKLCAECAADEVERLTAELGKAQAHAHDKEQGYERAVREANELREQLRLANIDACNLQAELADANKRIEELEKRDATWNKWYGAHMKRAAIFITEAEIDAAWRTSFSWHALEPLGIVACSECGGAGEFPDRVQAWDVPGAPIPECEPCHGHGWRIKK